MMTSDHCKYLFQMLKFQDETSLAGLAGGLCHLDAMGPPWVHS